MTAVVETPSRNLAKVSDRHDWIAFGWFTDDPLYRPLTEQLAISLDRFNVPYDFAAVAKLPGGWEANTRQKPAQLLAAMDRHPGKTIVLLDVDFTAIADISWLADASGDIALQLAARRRSNGSTRLIASAQVIVVKPTLPARRFVEAWLRLSSTPSPGDTAEAFLALAMGECASGCTFSNIDQDRIRSSLAHHWASRNTTRMNGFGREAMHLFFRAIGRARTRKH